MKVTQIWEHYQYWKLRNHCKPEKWVVWDPNPNQFSVWVKTARSCVVGCASAWWMWKFSLFTYCSMHHFFWKPGWQVLVEGPSKPDNTEKWKCTVFSIQRRKLSVINIFRKKLLVVWFLELTLSDTVTSAHLVKNCFIFTHLIIDNMQLVLGTG